MKKIIAVLLLLTMCLGMFSACTTDENDKGPIVRMYVTSYPRSLDPSALQPSAEITKLLGLIYEGLTAIDEEGKVVPALAYNWYGKYDTKDEQYKMYFELNTTKWSDGVGVSADDVIFAWTRILDPSSDSPYASLLFGIQNAKDVKSGVLTRDSLGVAAVDDTLLEITFAPEYAYDEASLARAVDLFAETVSALALVPLREIVVAKNDDWMTKASEATTNGPFKVQLMEYDELIVLERSSYYRLTEDDKYDKYVKPYKLVIEYNNNSQNAIGFQEERFNAGTTYYLGALTADGYLKYGEKVHTTEMLSSSALYFNTTSTLLSKAETRRALSLAIDREALVAAVSGKNVAATGYVPHGVFNTDASVSFREASTLSFSTKADVNGAKSLLSTAGVKGGTINFVYRTNLADASNDKAAQIIKEAWEALGFTVNLKKLGGVNYSDAIKNREFDVVMLDIVGNTTDAFGFLAPFARYYSGQVVSVSLEDESFTPHITGIESDEYDALIDSIVYVTDRTERANLLHQAEAKLMELMPATPLFFYTESYVTSDSLSKVGNYYYGYRNFNKTKLKDYLAVNEAYESEQAALESDAAQEQE